MGQVLLVGCDQRVTACIQRVGGSVQGTVLLRGAGTADYPGGFTGCATQAGHVVKNGLSHGLGVLAVGKRLIITVAQVYAQRWVADGRKSCGKSVGKM